MKGCEGGATIGYTSIFKYLNLCASWNQQVRVRVVVWNQRRGLNSQEGNL